MCALGLWILTQLRHVFRTVRDGQPFLSTNAKRIRLIGFAVILGEFARAAGAKLFVPFVPLVFLFPGIGLDTRVR